MIKADKRGPPHGFDLKVDSYLPFDPDHHAQAVEALVQTIKATLDNGNHKAQYCSYFRVSQASMPVRWLWCSSISANWLNKLPPCVCKVPVYRRACPGRCR